LVDLPVFDADNHYYEALDAFTRYIDPAMQKRGIQWATIDGKERLLVGGRINRFIPNPTFEHVSRPGALSEYFRAKSGVGEMRSAFGELEPISTRLECRDRQARLGLMDQQGLEDCIMLPTIGVGMEAALEHDQDACTAVFTAFNRWLDEDWGLNFKDRIYATPYVSLIDLDWAVAELEWALERDVRMVLMRPGSVNTRSGRRTPGDRAHDRFWAHLNEAGVTLAIHGGDSGYFDYEQIWGLTGEVEAFRQPPLKRLLSASPIHDMMASLMSDRLFERFPNLRVATIETGSGWVSPPPPAVAKDRHPTPARFRDRPVRSVHGARLGFTVLRRQRASARWPDGCQAGPVRLRLSPRRRTRCTHFLREGAPRVHRRRRAPDHARQCQSSGHTPTGMIGHRRDG